MRGSGKVLVAGFVLALFATAGIAFAAEKEPASGGLLSLPGDAVPAPMTAAPPLAPAPTLAEPREKQAPAAPAAAPTPAPAGAADASPKEDDTSWGVLVRGGYFGVPNFIADELFTQHPDVEGSSYGAEIRYHGNGGGRGIASIGLSVDSGTAKADGIWQESATDKILNARGEFDVLAIALTGYWSIFPSWYVHPYFGLGIGAAHVKGFYKNDTERVDADIWIPSIHIPVGLAVELGKRFQLAIEGRLTAGIAVGGALQVRF